MNNVFFLNRVVLNCLRLQIVCFSTYTLRGVNFYFCNIFRFKDSELEFLSFYDSIMNPLAIALDILQGEKDTYMGTLLPTIVYLLECLRKKKEQLLESEQLVYVPLVDAIIEGVRKRFDSKMMNKQLIASSILLPKYKDGWTDDNMQLRRGKNLQKYG